MHTHLFCLVHIDQGVHAEVGCTLADDSSKALLELGQTAPRGSAASECAVCGSSSCMASSAGPADICARTSHLPRPLLLQVQPRLISSFLNDSLVRDQSLL